MAYTQEQYDAVRSYVGGLSPSDASAFKKKFSSLSESGQTEVINRLGGSNVQTQKQPQQQQNLGGPGSPYVEQAQAQRTTPRQDMNAIFDDFIKTQSKDYSNILTGTPIGVIAETAAKSISPFIATVGPQKAADYLMLAARGLGTGIRQAESLVAGPMSAIQRGKPSEIYSEMQKAVEGESKEQFSDVWQRPFANPVARSLGAPIGFLASMGPEAADLIAKSVRPGVIKNAMNAFTDLQSNVMTKFGERALKTAKSFESLADEITASAASQTRAFKEKVGNLFVNKQPFAEIMKELKGFPRKEAEVFLYELKKTGLDLKRNLRLDDAFKLQEVMANYLNPSKWGDNAKGMAKVLEGSYFKLKDLIKATIDTPALRKEGNYLQEFETLWDDAAKKYSLAGEIKDTVLKPGYTRSDSYRFDVPKMLKAFDNRGVVDASKQLAFQGLKKTGIPGVAKKAEQEILGAKKLLSEEAFNRFMQIMGRSVVGAGTASAVGAGVYSLRGGNSGGGGQ